MLSFAYFVIIMRSFKEKKITVQPEQEGLRLDVFLSEAGLLSRAKAGKSLKAGEVTKTKPLPKAVIKKPSHKVKAGESYSLVFKEKKELSLEPYDFPLPFVFEDEHILVVNKPAGLTSHPGPGHERDSVVNALIGKTKLSSGTDPLRPGVVHRLDKDVSGLMILSKTEKAQKFLIEGFKKKTIKRIYKVVSAGRFKESMGSLKSFIGRHPKDRKKFYSFKEQVVGAKPALTHYRVLKSFNNIIHHIECRLETGRTHQIRVHLSAGDLPVLGDGVYFPARRRNRLLKDLDPKLKSLVFSLKRPVLYSAFLGFKHPVSLKPMSFCLPWPKVFNTLMDKLQFKSSFDTAF